jgi:hypothetical protein
VADRIEDALLKNTRLYGDVKANETFSQEFYRKDFVDANYG